MARRARKSNPAASVIDKFGLGIRPLARELGLDPATVFMWRERGRIPAGQQRAVLDLAKRRNVALTADDLIA